MCCCNEDRPEFRFVTEDGDLAKWESYRMSHDGNYQIVSVNLYGGYDSQVITFTVRPQE